MYAHNRRLRIAVLVWSFLFMTGCSVSNTVTVAAPAGTQMPLELPITTRGAVVGQVVIRSMAFVPSDISIKPGDTVTWVNDDVVSHTITGIYHFQDEDDVSHVFIGESWDSGDIKSGQSYSRTFDQSGTFEYLSLPLHVSSPMEQYYQFIAHSVVGVVTVE